MRPILVYYKDNIFVQQDNCVNIKIAGDANKDDVFFHTFIDIEKVVEKEDISAIFVMLTLSDNVMECVGLQMVHYIRILGKDRRVGMLPMFLIGTETLEEVMKISDYSGALRTPAIRLLPYSREKVMEVVKECNDGKYPGLATYEAYSSKAAIPVPGNYPSHHSITSEWSLYKWSKALEITSSIDVRVERNLYYRYVMSLSETVSPHSVSLNRPPYDKKESRRILVVDDEGEKGWNALYKKLFEPYKNIKLASLDGFDYSSGSRSELLKSVKEALTPMALEYTQLVILDIRLLQDDFYKSDGYSSFEIIRELQSYNKGIQVIVVTASNKIWNHQFFIESGAYACITKEAIGDGNVSEKKLNEILQKSLEAIEIGEYLRKIANLDDEIKKKIKEYLGKWTDDKRKRLLLRVEKQLDMIWNLLMNYRYNSKYLEYAYLACYQILEQWTEPKEGLFIRTPGNGKIYCMDRNGNDVNCSEKLHVVFENTENYYQIRVGKTEDDKERLNPKSSYARVAVWLYLRNNTTVFSDWMRFSKLRNEIAHGQGGADISQVKNKIHSLLALIKDVVYNAA